jgi:hypothetical protein
VAGTKTSASAALSGTCCTHFNLFAQINKLVSARFSSLTAGAGHPQHSAAAAVNPMHWLQLCLSLVCRTLRPPAAGGGEKEDPGIHSISLHPLHPEQIFVSNQSSSLYLMNMSGQVIKAMQSGKREGGGAPPAAAKKEAVDMYGCTARVGGSHVM